MAIARLALIGLAALALALAGGCNQAGAGSSPVASAPPATGTTTPSAAPASLPPSTSPTGAPTVASRTPGASTASPPAAMLVIGDEQVAGQLGTFCWLGTCADMFELPPKTSLPAVAAADGDELTFSIAAAAGVTEWSAQYADSHVSELAIIEEGGEYYDPDTSMTAPPAVGEASFAAPPAGDWVLLVQVRFANGGDAQYLWHVTVE